MGEEKSYVHGVTDDDVEPFGADGAGGATERYAVEHRGLSAIASDAGTGDPEESEEFDEAVADLRDRFDEVTVQYSGPWRPYRFVDLHLGVAR